MRHHAGGEASPALSGGVASLAADGEAHDVGASAADGEPPLLRTRLRVIAWQQAPSPEDCSRWELGGARAALGAGGVLPFEGVQLGGGASR